MRRRFNWDKRYLYWGVTAFCVIAAALLFYFAVSKVSVIGNSFSRLVQILAPFIWGLVISYLLTPLMTSIEKHLFFPLSKKIYKNSKKNTGKGFARGMSVLLSEIVLVLILVALVYLILPQMLSSIQTLIQNSGIYMDNLSAWLDGLFKNYPLLDQYVGDMLESININLGNWLQTTLLPRLGNVVTSVTSGVYGVAKSIYNLIIGIIVSIYLLNDKEGFLAAVKRMSYSVFSVETVERIRIGLNFVDKTYELPERQTAGLLYHRHYLLYCLLHPADALYTAGQCDRRCDEYHPLLWPADRCSPERSNHPDGESDQVSDLRDLCDHSPADRREHHRTAHSGQLHRHHGFLGNLLDHSGRRSVRLLGNVPRRAGVCRSLLPCQQPDCKEAEAE